LCIRSPLVDAPIAMLAGNGNGARPPAFPGEVVPPTSRFCAIFGQTVPFTDAELAASYPDHERVCDHLILIADARPVICAEIDVLMAEHKLLSAPLRDTKSIERQHSVVTRAAHHARSASPSGCDGRPERCATPGSRNRPC
jgi:hypothetical protein